MPLGCPTAEEVKDTLDVARQRPSAHPLIDGKLCNVCRANVSERIETKKANFCSCGATLLTPEQIAAGQVNC